MILLQNQEPEFYNILHLISLYKIKDPYMLGKKGFRGMLYEKIKDLRVSQALSLKNQLHAQKVRFCALPADCWGPCLQNHGPTKI